MEPLTTRNPRARIFPVDHTSPTFYDLFKNDLFLARMWSDTVMFENAEEGPWFTNELYYRIGCEAFQEGKRIVAVDPLNKRLDTIDNAVFFSGATAAGYGAYRATKTQTRREFAGMVSLGLLGVLFAGATDKGEIVRDALGDDVFEHTRLDTTMPSVKDFRETTIANQMNSMPIDFGKTLLYIGARHVADIKYYLDNPSILRLKSGPYRQFKEHFIEYSPSSVGMSSSAHHR